MTTPSPSSRMDLLASEIRQFIRARDWEQYHTPKNLAMALSVEAAEIVELFQWLTPDESRALSPQQQAALREEIGDVLIYLITLAERLGIHPVEAAEEKLRINARKYPVDKVRGKAQKYDQY